MSAPTTELAQLDKSNIAHIEDPVDVKAENAAADYSYDEQMREELANSGQGITGYESLSPLQALKALPTPALYAFLMTFSSVCDGYQVAMGGSIVANAGFVEQFGTGVNAKGAVYLKANTLSNWGLAFSICQTIGQLTIGPISDKIGRRYATWYFSIVLAIGMVLESTVMNWQGWLAGRALGGLGIGCVQAFVPIYVSETAPVALRGAINVCYTFWFGLGQLVGNLALQQIGQSKPMEYKIPIFSQWGMIGLMFIIYAFIPETPIWCVKTGRMDMARRMSRKLYRGVKDFDEERYIQLISLTLDHERRAAEASATYKWYAPILGTNRLRTLTVFIPLFSQGWLGLTIFFSQATYFFQQIGFADPFKVTCIINGLLMAGSVITSTMIDKLGRRRPYLIGATIMWLMCVGVGALSLTTQTKQINAVLTFFTCVWVVVFPLQVGVGAAYQGEVPSSLLRAKTVSLAAGLNTGINVGMGYVYPYMLSQESWNWGLKTAWFFVGTGFPCLVAAFFLVPETSQRSVGEIDEMYEHKVSPRRFKQYETVVQRALKQQSAGGVDPQSA